MDSYSNADPSSDSAARLLMRAASLVSPTQYLVAFLFVIGVFLYNLLEIHLVRDILTGLRGDPVSLTFDSSSEICRVLISKCPVLRGRYLPTPWLSSPHLQTAFLHFFGRPPVFQYRRQIFHVSDGGTIALDWLVSSDGLRSQSLNVTDDSTPIVIVIPGLTSDSASNYIKHLVYGFSKRGWNVVVSNHRGLGGISITSDCFYNAGWTEDLRKVVNHLHQDYPKSPLFAVGTSIGANVLVKYLGEAQDDTPISGAASICSPWDLVVCDRFINRRLVQKFYDRVLTIGLQGYAQLHQPILSRLTDWESIKKSRSVRDFDNHVTCLVGKFETVDTYYRRCSSANYVENVSVPLLCISALDDPVCTKEAIPWDECRANKNIVLATTAHGGHLGYFEGIGASRIWWVRAVTEYLYALHDSPFMHREDKTESSRVRGFLDSSIDKGPYVNVMEDGMVTALGSEAADCKESFSEPHHTAEIHASSEAVPDTIISDAMPPELGVSPGDSSTPEQHLGVDANVCSTIRNSIRQLSRCNKTSMWLLLYIAIVTTWPLVGSALLIFGKRKLRNVLPAAWLKRLTILSGLSRQDTVVKCGSRVALMMPAAVIMDAANEIVQQTLQSMI